MLVMCEQLERRAQVDLERKERELGKLLRTVKEQRAHGSTTTSTRGSTLGSPSGQLVNDDGDEPPLLELMHHPELLLTLNETDP
jgi:hypothetical protein